MIRTLLLTLLLSVTMASFAEDSTPIDKCKKVRCKGELCGCTLLQKGWKEIARCDKRIWEYLIEKGKRRMLCEGVVTFNGINEEPCTAFMGRVDEFLRCRP